MNVGSVNVTDTPRAATLIGQCGVSLASEAEEYVTVCTTQKDVNVKTAKPASTETPTDPKLPPTPANPVTVIPWAPCPSIWPMARSATPPMETASANLEWVVPTVTGAWWDTGASMNTAADHVTVQETVILSLETACLGLIWTSITWRETLVSR